jgi:outer membrane protein assembly factor BamA
MAQERFQVGLTEHRWRQAFRVLVCVGLALCMLGCVGRARRKAKRQLRLQPKIVTFEIEGNQKISDQYIFSRIQSGLPPQFSYSSMFNKPRFDELVFETDLQRIESIYRARGYYDAKVIEHKVLPLSEDEVSLWVNLEEGEPIKVEELQFRFADGTNAPQELQDFVTGVSTPFPKNATLRLNEVFVYDTYSRIREELAARITNQGYAQANIRGLAQVDTLNHKAYISFLIDPGPVCSFGAVEFVGLKPLDAKGKGLTEKDLRKYLAFTRGEPFTRPKLTATQQNLFDTGSFAAVNIEPKFVEGKKEVDIVISIEQVQRHRVQAGGGFELDANSRFNLRGKLAWLDRSVSGGMSKLQASTSGGTAMTIIKTETPQLDGNGQPVLNEEGNPVNDIARDFTFAPVFNITGAFSLPYVLSPRRSFSTTAGLLFDSPADGLATATVPLHFEFDRDLLGEKKDRAVKAGRVEGPSELSTKAFSYGYGYTFQLVGLCFLVAGDNSFCADQGDAEVGASLAALGIGAGKNFFQLGYLEQHIIYNRTDDPADPKKGITLSLNLHEGAGPLAFQSPKSEDAFNYLRVLPEARGYWPLNRKKTFVFASRLQLGALLIKNENVDNQNQSPFPERFFLGGASSHRAFGFQGLSPIQDLEDNNGNIKQIPIGGNAMFLTSAELRFDTSFGLRLAAFTDIGVVPPFFADIPSLTFKTTAADGSTLINDLTIRSAVGAGVRYVYGPLVFRGDVAALVDNFNEIQGVFGFQQEGNIFSFMKFQLSIGEAF